MPLQRYLRATVRPGARQPGKAWRQKGEERMSGEGNWRPLSLWERVRVRGTDVCRPCRVLVRSSAVANR